MNQQACDYTQIGYICTHIGYTENPKMGVIRSLGLARALFSQVQLRVLSLFFSDPSRQFHLAQVIKLAGSGRGAVQREVEKLTHAGILSVTRNDGRKIYQANHQSPVFEELCGLILKTAGLVEPIQKALKQFARKIKVAFIFGSVAKERDTATSDVDLMIICHDLTYGDVYLALQKAENNILRKISPNLLTPDEWKQRLSNQNSFVVKVAQQPKLFVFGTDDELKRIGQSGRR